jgi:hypothetical protein
MLLLSHLSLADTHCFVERLHFHLAHRSWHLHAAPAGGAADSDSAAITVAICCWSWCCQCCWCCWYCWCWLVLLVLPILLVLRVLLVLPVLLLNLACYWCIAVGSGVVLALALVFVLLLLLPRYWRMRGVHPVACSIVSYCVRIVEKLLERCPV